jgi:hypothetical protein
MRAPAEPIRRLKHLSCHDWVLGAPVGLQTEREELEELAA